MEQPRTSLRRRARLSWIVAIAVIGAVGTYAALKLRRGPDAPAPAAADATPAPAPAEPPVAAAGPADAPVGAEGARALFEAATANPLARKLMGDEGLIGRCAVIIANLAEGVSPRKALTVLAPSTPFSVEQRGERVVMSPASYRRYDAFAAAVDSIDAQALATAYRRLHAVLEAAYRALGYPAGSLDRATVRALRRIEKAPVVDSDVEVQPEGGIWVIADARLEALSQVEKHLLRMGSRNERLVQAKARDVRQALQLPDPVAAGKK